MCDAADADLTALSSLCSSSTRPPRIVPTVWKSDMYIPPRSELEKLARARNRRNLPFSDTKSTCGEYCKKCDRDEISLRDYYSFSLQSDDTGTGDNTRSNSELMRQNLSQDLDTDTSVGSLESNTKFFRTTVQQIFDSFHSSMPDLAHYKAKFQEICAKNNVDSMVEMEQFIKDMIQHIMSPKSVQDPITGSTQTASTRSFLCTSDDKLTDDNVLTPERDLSPIDSYTSKSQSATEDSCKTENLMPDCARDEQSVDSKRKRSCQDGGTPNSPPPTAKPSLEIRTNERQMVSEVNIRHSKMSGLSKVASAENSKKLAAKKREIEIYARASNDFSCTDRNIPVRVSSAKKDIHFDDEFVRESNKHEPESFMTKVCKYLCRKLRKG